MLRLKEDRHSIDVLNIMIIMRGMECWVLCLCFLNSQSCADYTDVVMAISPSFFPRPLGELPGLLQPMISRDALVL